MWAPLFLIYFLIGLPRKPHVIARLSQRSHIDATSAKTRNNTAEGPNLHCFCKLGDALYPVLQFKDDFVTR
jgi:hypothetical protein